MSKISGIYAAGMSIFNEDLSLNIEKTILRNSNYQDRITKIKSILDYILNKGNHKKIAEALYKDLRKSNEEVIATCNKI